MQNLRIQNDSKLSKLQYCTSTMIVAVEVVLPAFAVLYLREIIMAIDLGPHTHTMTSREATKKSRSGDGGQIIIDYSYAACNGLMKTG